MANEEEEEKLDLTSRLVDTYQKANAALLERVSIMKESYKQAAREDELVKQVLANAKAASKNKKLSRDLQREATEGDVLSSEIEKERLKLEEKRGPLVQFEEQWEVRHVLLTPSAIRDVDITKAEIELLRERVLSGESFSEIAKEFSEDPGSGSSGGSLDWLPKGATVPEFEEVMINSELNVVSEVFESQFGFHFLEVTGKRIEDITDLLIEDRAYSVLFSRKFDEELENTLRTMRAEAFVEYKDLD